MRKEEVNQVYQQESLKLALFGSITRTKNLKTARNLNSCPTRKDLKEQILLGN